MQIRLDKNRRFFSLIYVHAVEACICAHTCTPRLVVLTHVSIPIKKKKKQSMRFFECFLTLYLVFIA